MPTTHSINPVGRLVILTIFMIVCQNSVSLENASGPATSAGDYPEPLPLAVPVKVNGFDAVVNEQGKLLIPFDNDYEQLFPADFQNTLWARRNGPWQLIDRNEKVIHPGISPFLNRLTPGYFAFEENGKYGIIDVVAGKIVAPARYDDLYASGEGAQYITYEISGKRGIMDARGKVVTEALYEDTNVRSSLKKHAGLIPGGTREGGYWVIDTKTGEQKRVVYDYINYPGFKDGFGVVSLIESSGEGLIDENGDLVVPMEYAQLDLPSQGFIAFRKSSGSPCGYMDTKGKVIIEAQFETCLPFGKKGAFIQEQGAGLIGKFFLIDRNGQRVAGTPEFDYVDTMGSVLGNMANGFVSIAMYPMGMLGTASLGIFNVDDGRVVIAPDSKYKQLSAVTPNLFVFSAHDSPMFPNMLPAVGLMDAKGKALFQPSQFERVDLHESGKYLVASGQGVNALIDLDGRELIAPQWTKLEVDERLNAIFAYDQWKNDEGETYEQLRAAYALNGKPLFIVRETDCGAEQLFDGAGKLIWPQDAQPFCEE
jgi:hypothetical protein